MEAELIKQEPDPRDGEVTSAPVVRNGRVLTGALFAEHSILLRPGLQPSQTSAEHPFSANSNSTPLKNVNRSRETLVAVCTLLWRHRLWILLSLARLLCSLSPVTKFRATVDGPLHRRSPIPTQFRRHRRPAQIQPLHPSHRVSPMRAVRPRAQLQGSNRSARKESSEKSGTNCFVSVGCAQ